jgi:hypothetical protein
METLQNLKTLASLYQAEKILRNQLELKRKEQQKSKKST